MRAIWSTRTAPNSRSIPSERAAASTGSRWGSRMRPSVTWAENGRPSRGKPSFASASSIRVASSTTSGPPRTPAQITRGRVGDGKAPRPRSTSWKAGLEGATSARVLATPSRRSGSTPPRNLSVRWRFWAATQLTLRALRLSRSISVARAARTASGSRMATKARTVAIAWAPGASGDSRYLPVAPGSSRLPEPPEGPRAHRHGHRPAPG
jgi:hypothetical protein